HDTADRLVGQELGGVLGAVGALVEGDGVGGQHGGAREQFPGDPQPGEGRGGDEAGDGGHTTPVWKCCLLREALVCFVYSAGSAGGSAVSSGGAVAVAGEGALTGGAAGSQRPSAGG